MDGLSNYKPRELGMPQQTVKVGFVIVTEECGDGMGNIHDRRPVVLKAEDAWRWVADSRLRRGAHRPGEISADRRIV